MTETTKENLCPLCHGSLREYSSYFSLTYLSENYVHLCGRCADNIGDIREQNALAFQRKALKRADKKMLEIYKEKINTKEA